MTEASGAVPTQVFAAPQPDGSFPLVLELHGSSIARIVAFQDPALFTMFAFDPH